VAEFFESLSPFQRRTGPEGANAARKLAISGRHGRVVDYVALPQVRPAPPSRRVTREFRKFVAIDRARLKTTVLFVE